MARVRDVYIWLPVATVLLLLLIPNRGYKQALTILSDRAYFGPFYHLALLSIFDLNLVV
jgi:hypothetical protein